MANIKSWKDIQWRPIEQTVYLLQLRIFKAASNQEFEKMYKLQKVLTGSSSAKYLAVKHVTPGVDGKIIFTPKEQFQLASQLTIDGKSSPIIDYPNGKQTWNFQVPTIEDRAKQMLAYLALSPQWEARFEAGSYGFRPGRSVQDAVEAVFLGISKKPKWVLDADISKCFDEINHEYLLEKCQTYPRMRKQIRSWLKAGILTGKEYIFPAKGGILSPLLANIALDGLRKRLDIYVNSLGGHRPNNRKSLTFVRYANDFVLMYPDKEVLLELQKVVQEFLDPIGLELHPTKTRIVHTLEGPPGFTFLGFDIVQRQKRTVKAFKRVEKKQTFITLITPSKEGIQAYKKKLRDTTRRYRGANQTRLIQVLNPIIRGWANSKRSQASSKTFQALDAYLWLLLWKWARKRHPKMPKSKLKGKYWHIQGNKNWIFGVTGKDGKEIKLRLQTHSKISIQRHAKVKGTDLIYWASRKGKSILLH